MSPDLPPDPMTATAAGAAQMHELFTAYVEVGFTRPEAMQVVLALITTNIAWNLEHPTPDAPRADDEGEAAVEMLVYVDLNRQPLARLYRPAGSHYVLPPGLAEGAHAVQLWRGDELIEVQQL